MNDDVMTIRFPAVLEDMSGQVIEYGSAEIAPEPNSLNFISGFIPLYPMGTKIAVVWLRDDNRLERLRGEVYLSHVRCCGSPASIRPRCSAFTGCSIQTLN